MSATTPLSYENHRLEARHTGDPAQNRINGERTEAAVNLTPGSTIIQFPVDLNHKRAYLGQHLVVRDAKPGRRIDLRRAAGFARNRPPAQVAVVFDERRLVESGGLLQNGLTIFYETDWRWDGGFLHYHGHEGNPRTLILLYGVQAEPTWNSKDRYTLRMALESERGGAEADDAEDGPASESNDVIAALTALVAERHAWTSAPYRQFGRGSALAIDTMAVLRTFGIECEIVRLQGYRGDPSKAVARWRDIPCENWSHYLVMADDLTVDLTAQQFIASARLPQIRSVDRVKRLWTSIEPTTESGAG